MPLEFIMRVCTRDEKHFCKHQKSLTATFNRSTAAQYTMKKFLLILSIFVVSLSAFAADLNPFAYGLYADANTNPSGSPDCVMGLHWKINAAVTTMKVIIIDENGAEYEYRSYDGRAAGGYGTSVTHSRMAMLGIPYGQELKWRIDVTGAAVANATKVDKEYYFYRPTSVDTDDNFESPNFGRILCNESYQEIKGKSGTGEAGAYSTYKSYGYGAGLYEFNAQFDFIGAHNGGNTFKVYREDNKNSKESEKSQAPHRIRIADDGCIFVTSFNGGAAWGGKLLWKVDTATLDTWAPMFGYHSVSNVSQLLTSDGYFIAAPNVGFDVKGEGSALQMLMLSANSNHVNGYESAFRCYEYDWGNANSWSTAPSRKWFDGNSSNNFNATYKAINHYGTQVQYDNKGGIWMCQYQSTSQEKYPSLVYYDNNQIARYHEVMNNRAGGGFRFNKDFTRVIISGGNGKVGEATVYTVSNDANGYPVKLTKEFTISMGLGNNITDYAWDIADNIYAVSYSKEKLVAYALPHTANKVVSTYAASKYKFTIDCVPGEYYDVNVASSDLARGIVEGGGTVASCEIVEVFAKSKVGYKFVCWKDGDNVVSSQNPYKFPVTKNITLIAYFEAGDYTVTWWNLFKEDQDISKPEYDTKWNTRLWRLYQAQFEGYIDKLQQQGVSVANRNDKGYVTGYEEYDVAGFITERFEQNANYLSADVSNETTPFAWLGEYIEHVNGKEIVYKNSNATLNARWAYMLYMFINRTTIPRATNGGDVTGFAAPDYTDKNFIEHGKPEHWRPWWSDRACNLPKTVGSEKSLPITWQKLPCSTLTVKNDAGTVIGTPADWYQWYTAPKSDQLLAWRDGGTTGRIVHHVYRDNMKLYATYVDAHLQENDPQPDLSKNPYDATNNDVLDLLANKNHGSTLLNFTIDRKFVGGMYNTVCFPFDLPLSKLPEGLKDADIRVFNGATESNEFGESVVVLNFITLQEYWQNETAEGNPPYLKEPYLQAGVPYLIKPIADVDADLAFSNFDQVLIWDGTKTPYNKIFGDVTFQGVFNPTDLPENAYILVANNRLAKVTDGNEKMKGFRGYFTWNDPVRMPPAKMSISIGKQTPTAVEEIVDDQIIQPAAPKVRKVMYDGQIYILRGEEVYTITGHRVK